MVKSIAVWALCGVFAAAAGAAWAQAGGAGAGPGPRMQAPGPGASGPGMGAGRHMGGRAGPDHTPGWPMMNSKERGEHRDRMRSMMNQGECMAYSEEHRKEMEARAKERGGKALRMPRHDGCAGLKP